MNTQIAAYIAIPFISGFIGWVTNLLAVRMIFRPRTPVRVLWVRVQGLIPRRRSELARSIGETVEKELISHEDLQRAAQSSAFRNQIGRAVRARIDEFLENAVGRGPVMTMLLSGEVAAALKDLLVAEVQKQVPEAVEVVLQGMESNLSFKKVIQQKIESFEMDRLESLVRAIAARELRMIEILGGVLGFIIGIFQVAIFVFATRYAS